ncbi:MAG: ribonuclease HII [Candidatus Paceibacterota bacterium]|jgi:ribonuclease HII
MSKSKTTQGVIGIDEVGRGPLAGPVTLCAVYLENEEMVKSDIFQNIIRDSKKISKPSRYNIYSIIRENRYLKSRIIYAIASRSAEHIDKYGINKSVSQCIRSCVNELRKKGIPINELKINLDAGLVVPIKELKQESFIKGDEKYTEIALASILAKETRDSYMKKLSKKHPEYFWDKNVGYATKKHREMIKKYGITKYHRKLYLKAFELFDKAE